MNTKRFDTVTAAFTLICAGCLAVYAYFMLTVPEPPHYTAPWLSPDDCYERLDGGWAVTNDMENLN
nr:hypothetical protein [Clostridia bacterium]